jgi:4-hydroxythreonine-4-phosphate dehydrogenase
MKPVIAVSMGDYNGIGPEVILKAFGHIDFSDTIPLVIGQEKVFQYYDQKIQTGFSFRIINDPDEITETPGTIHLIRSSGNQSIKPTPGIIDKSAGKESMLAVEKGTELSLSGSVSALVTAPISKESINKAGYHYPGHTEFLAEKCGIQSVQMILVNENLHLRVALVTIHIPVKEIASTLTKGLIEEKIRQFDTSLRSDFDMKNPSIAVLGLNPHAGDGGIIGREEIEIIEPAIKRIKEQHLHVEGPFPADGFFGNHSFKHYDGTLAMYHDQGLIPFKTLSFGQGVNFTAGLPFIRTSPDHGTGFDIAGKNIASENSFKSAYELAAKMAVTKYQVNE